MGRRERRQRQEHQLEALDPFSEICTVVEIR